MYLLKKTRPNATKANITRTRTKWQLKQTQLELKMFSQTHTASVRGTKHVLTVNLAQIPSAVPEIFDAQNKMKK